MEPVQTVGLSLQVEVALEADHFNKGPCLEQMLLVLRPPGRASGLRGSNNSTSRGCGSDPVQLRHDHSQLQGVAVEPAVSVTAVKVAQKELWVPPMCTVRLSYDRCMDDYADDKPGGNLPAC